MNRLTIKECNRYEDFVFNFRNKLITSAEIDASIYKKLKQLEDIEEELGIDLLTLFKALKQDYIYVKNHYGWSNAFKINKEYIQGLKYADDNTPVFWTDDCGKEHMIYIKNYGKSWALTEEELENE